MEMCDARKPHFFDVFSCNLSSEKLVLRSIHYSHSCSSFRLIFQFRFFSNEVKTLGFVGVWFSMIRN